MIVGDIANLIEYTVLPGINALLFCGKLPRVSVVSMPTGLGRNCLCYHIFSYHDIDSVVFDLLQNQLFAQGLVTNTSPN